MIEKLNLKLNGNIPVNREELFELVNSWGRKIDFSTYDDIEIKKCEPKECYDLSNLNVSKIKNLSYVFRYSYFNGDISNWDVSNCRNMERMFSYSEFNNDSLNYWNISNVIYFSYMFFETNFNGNLFNWKLSPNIVCLQAMFTNSCFDGDISSWQFNKNDNFSCFEIFYNNQSFENKYNSGNKIPKKTESFLKWFEKNRNKIKEINSPKEEVLDFFSFEEKEILIKKEK